MHLTPLLRLSLTGAQLASKSGKQEYILVKCLSLASGYRVDKIRKRLDDKLEFVSWDPTVEQDVLYREEKKLKSVKTPLNNRPYDYASMFERPEAGGPKELEWHRIYDCDKEAMARVDAIIKERDALVEKWGKKKVKKKPRGQKL